MFTTLPQGKHYWLVKFSTKLYISESQTSKKLVKLLFKDELVISQVLLTH